jgi:hypothetical protein
MLRISPTARSIPFDSTGTRFTAKNVRDAILQAGLSLQANRANFTLTTQDVSNGYLELPVSEVVPNATSVFVDRLALFPDLDYTISTVAGKVRITFAGNFATNQPEAPSSGDNIHVLYWTV